MVGGRAVRVPRIAAALAAAVVANEGANPSHLAKMQTRGVGAGAVTRKELQVVVPTRVVVGTIE